MWSDVILRLTLFLSPMPLPEIHYSHAFGMGFWIAEDGTLMSCPAVHHTMDVDNAIAVEEWDDFTVYSHNHMAILAQIVQICTLRETMLTSVIMPNVLGQLLNCHTRGCTSV